MQLKGLLATSGGTNPPLRSWLRAVLKVVTVNSGSEISSNRINRFPSKR